MPGVLTQGELEILYSLNQKYEVKDKSFSKTFTIYNFGKTILTKKQKSWE